MNRTGRQRHKDKRTRTKNNGHPRPSVLPRKRKDYHYSRVPKRCLLSFSNGVKLLVFFASCLVPGFCRCRSCPGSRTNVLRWRRDISPLVRSHANEQIAVSDGRPFSHVPSFGGHFCPGVSRPVPADGGSRSFSSGSILPSLLSKLTHTSGGISGLSD